MSNLIIYILFAIVCFLIIAIAIALFHKDAIFTIAIGSVIGANVYNIGNYPIEIGNLVFGIDGIVYCIFLFCLLLMYIDYGKQSMQLNLYTALFSIFFTALLAFFGTYFVNQDLKLQIWSTLSYIFSIIATYIAVIAMVMLYDTLKSKNSNPYLSFGLCMIVGSLSNSIIYFGLTFLTSGSLGTNFIYALIGSAITKLITTLACILIFYLYEKFWRKKEQKI